MSDIKKDLIELIRELSQALKGEENIPLWSKAVKFIGRLEDGNVAVFSSADFPILPQPRPEPEPKVSLPFAIILAGVISARGQLEFGDRYGFYDKAIFEVECYLNAIERSAKLEAELNAARGR